MPGLLPHNQTMLTPQSVRQSLLDMAGMTKEHQARLVKKVFDKLEQKLEAKHTHVVSYEGEVTELIEMEDNQAQIRAAERLANLTGIEPSKDINAGAVKIVVEVKLPDWAKPEVIDVTGTPLDGQGQVIEDPAISTPSE